MFDQRESTVVRDGKAAQNLCSHLELVGILRKGFRQDKHQQCLIDKTFLLLEVAWLLYSIFVGN